MKVANTRKVNERIVQYMSREQLNSLLGMGLSAPVSVDEIIFEEKKEFYGNIYFVSKGKKKMICQDLERAYRGRS